MRVVFAPPERMNLLGYILRSLLERALSKPRLARRMRKVDRPIEIRASAMRVVLLTTGEEVVLRVPEQAGEPTARPAAWVRGDLEALLGLTLGRGLVRNLLRGRLRVGGRVWRLLPLLSLLRAREAG
ncbi:MAG: hypothetical protein GYA21_04835 [Myxococcales bacterium]|nr:hypothetical protein [Myxococcales bacterium]